MSIWCIFSVSINFWWNFSIHVAERRRQWRHCAFRHIHRCCILNQWLCRCFTCQHCGNCLTVNRNSSQACAVHKDIAVEGCHAWWNCNALKFGIAEGISCDCLYSVWHSKACIGLTCWVLHQCGRVDAAVRHVKNIFLWQNCVLCRRGRILIAPHKRAKTALDVWAFCEKASALSNKVLHNKSEMQLFL